MTMRPLSSSALRRRVRVVAVGLHADLPAGQGNDREAELLDSHGEQGHRDHLTSVEQHIHLASGRTLVQLGGLPQVAHRGQDRAFAFRSQRPHHDVLARRGGFEVVHHAEALFAPVHAREAAQEIEAFGLQAFGHPAESFRRHGEHPLAGLRPHGRRLPGLHFICQGHNSRFSSSTFKSFFSAVRSLRSSRSYSSRPICRFTPPKKRCSFTLR